MGDSIIFADGKSDGIKFEMSRNRSLSVKVEVASFSLTHRSIISRFIL